MIVSNTLPELVLAILIDNYSVLAGTLHVPMFAIISSPSILNLKHFLLSQVAYSHIERGMKENCAKNYAASPKRRDRG